MSGDLGRATHLINILLKYFVVFPNALPLPAHFSQGKLIMFIKINKFIIKYLRCGSDSDWDDAIDLGQGAGFGLPQAQALALAQDLHPDPDPDQDQLQTNQTSLTTIAIEWRSGGRLIADSNVSLRLTNSIAFEAE